MHQELGSIAKTEIRSTEWFAKEPIEPGRCAQTSATKGKRPGVMVKGLENIWEC